MVTDTILCFHNLFSAPDQSNNIVLGISSVTLKKKKKKGYTYDSTHSAHTYLLHTNCNLITLPNFNSLVLLPQPCLCGETASSSRSLINLRATCHMLKLLLIRLVLIHLHMIPLSVIHPRLRQAVYIMYPNRKEMEVTESVVTMIKYHSWRLTGLRGLLTDTIHGEWRGRERGRSMSVAWGKRWLCVGYKSLLQRLISQGLWQDKYFAYRSNTPQSPPLIGHAQ